MIGFPLRWKGNYALDLKMGIFAELLVQSVINQFFRVYILNWIYFKDRVVTEEMASDLI